MRVTPSSIREQADVAAPVVISSKGVSTDVIEASVVFGRAYRLRMLHCGRTVYRGPIWILWDRKCVRRVITLWMVPKLGVWKTSGRPGMINRRNPTNIMRSKRWLNGQIYRTGTTTWATYRLIASRTPLGRWWQASNALER